MNLKPVMSEMDRLQVHHDPDQGKVVTEVNE